MMQSQQTPCGMPAKWFVAWSFASSTLFACAETTPAPEVTPTDTGSVAEIYRQQCAACHGQRGEADGPLAHFLRPPPRSFAAGLFDLVSTDNAIPTDADLIASIRNGLPGTAMPSFAWLTDDQLRDLVRQVRELGIAGRARELATLAAHADQTIDLGALRQLAADELRPGRTFDAVAEAVATPALLEQGRGLYLSACAACHGEDGRGRQEHREWNERFGLRLPKDFTTGVLRGGASAVAIQHRIQCGMPAAGMPPARLEANELQALVAYVRQLIPASAQSQPSPRQLQLVAERVAALPSDAASDVWKSMPVVMWPLRSSPEAVPVAAIAALHDGHDLAVLVRWPDATRDASVFDAPLPDAVAVQLAEGRQPPFLAMGSADAAVNIWHWQTFAPREVQGFLDLLGARRQPNDAAPPLPRPGTTAALAAPAYGSASMPRFADRGRPIAVHHVWRDGYWHVMFRRPLQPDQAQEIVLRPGDHYHLAAAIWNGSADQRGRDKSITGWHELTLAR